MKIIALLPARYSHHTPGAIVELAGAELDRIVGSPATNGLVVGSEVHIWKRFDHAVKVLKECEEAKKLPNALRALADTLEMTHPAIEKIVETETEKETNEWA